MTVAGTNEYNIFKGVFFLNAVFVLFLLLLFFLVPQRTQLAESYAWIFVGWLALVAADLFILQPAFGGELLDTISADENPNWYPLQRWFGLSMAQIFPFMVLIGLVWGGFYFVQITQYHSGPYISVPNVFSATPVLPIFAVNNIDLDLIESSWTVANIEDSITAGLLFPILWFLLYLLMKRFSVPEPVALIAGLLIGSLLTGSLFSYVIHNAAYQGNLYAYVDATGYFTIASVLAGVSGTTVAGIEAHAIHNAAVKSVQQQGNYSVIPPPPAYVGG